MKEEEYYMYKVDGDEYERVTQHAGVKTTICKNRFEVICRDRAEVNEQATIAELRAWLSRRRDDAVREDGDMPRQV